MGGQMWIGVTTQKNGLGRLCLIAVFFLVWALIRRWRGIDISVGKHYQTYTDVFILVLTVYLLIGPGDKQFSATALTSLCAGLATFFCIIWMKKHRINVEVNMLTVIMALIIGFGILLPFINGASVSGFASNVGRDSTLTGRTDIWATLVPLAMQRPIFGSGIEGYCSPEESDLDKMCEAHNGYLEVVLVFGFVGLLFFIIFLISSCRKAQRLLRHDFDWSVLLICFFLMAFIHNISESSIFSFTSQLTAILLFLVVSTREVHSYKPGVEQMNVKFRYGKFPLSRKKIIRKKHLLKM
jgi:O-antigen ligase